MKKHVTVRLGERDCFHDEWTLFVEQAIGHYANVIAAEELTGDEVTIDGGPVGASTVFAAIADCWESFYKRQLERFYGGS